MKDVTEVLSKRLQRLENHFSRDWTFDFLSFIEFIQTNPTTIQVVTAIQKQKQDDHQLFLYHLKSLLEEGRQCLKSIQIQARHEEMEANSIDSQIKHLIDTKIDLKKIEDPFFEIESLYFDYYKKFVHLLSELAKNDSNAFVTNYCDLSCIKIQDTVHTEISLTFSDHLQHCKQQIEILSGKRLASAWGRWDLLMRWKEWTKNGFSPTNTAFENHLSRLFQVLRIAEATQSLGILFLERLNDLKSSLDPLKPPVKALELFLDDNDQYWIIAHFDGENHDKKPYFIKRLQRTAKGYKLLNLMLNSEAYTPIEFPTLSHVLGELEIKNELKKVFFPKDKFAGSLAHLHDCLADINVILNELSLLEKRKKHLPSFNWGYYYKACSSV